MTAVIAMVAVLAIAVWFYRTAERLNLPPLNWAIGGVAIYYGGFLVWMHGVLRPLLGGLFRTHGFWLGIGMDVSAILAGALCAVLFHSKVLLKKS
jgi:hypothetical protein